MHKFLLCSILFGSIICGCRQHQNSPKVNEAIEEDFAEEKDVSPVLAEGLTLDLWAPGPLLRNAVAVTFDHQGRAYISETTRRKSSDLDIRAHMNWAVDDLRLESTEDTKKFHLTTLDPQNSSDNKWIEDFNNDEIHDYRDLMVQSEYVNMVWDSDGDGRADKSRQFAEGFNGLITGIAAGILFHDNKIFLTAAPDLWSLEDSDQDGLADNRKSLSYGYGVHIAFAGHDMSGLTVGVDGKIYWSIGDLGINVTDPDGQNWKYPNQGCVMRSNIDGSDFEVFAHGLRNPQELAFDQYGNLISVDNDGDHTGEHERYVHITEGSDSGWRINWQYGKYNLPNEEYKVWMDEGLYLPHFKGQPAYITPAIALAYDGPAGIAYNPGTALGEDWKDYFFASYFTGSAANSKVEAFQIQHDGASFKIVNQKDVVGGIVPTGITFAPDGGLYINDWKDSYEKKPEGRLWKMDVSKGLQHALRVETRALLANGMTSLNTEELVTLLGHQDQRVRMEAQFELVKRENVPSLFKTATQGNEQMARLHAIWGLGQLGRTKKIDLSSILGLLQDRDHHVRGQAAKIFGECNFFPAENQLISLLQDVSPSVQFFAAESLGKLKSGNSLPSIITLVEKTQDKDPHLRHALMFAMSRLANSTQLAKLKSHPSSHVRIAAVVALRHQKSPLIRQFLQDDEELVLAETARAIHDDFSIPDALSDLAQRLIGPSVANEAFTRRSINANLRLGSESSAQRLADFAFRSKIPLAMKKEALWALGLWSSPPALDRVTGRYRGLKGHQLKDAQNAFSTAFNPSTIAPNDAFTIPLVEAIGRLKVKDYEEIVLRLFHDESSNNELKSAALITLAQLESTKTLAAISSALSSKSSSLRQLAQELLGNLNISEDQKLPLFESIMENNPWQEKQVALRALAKFQSSEKLLTKLYNQFLNEQLENEIQLDLAEAIEEGSFASLKTMKSKYESSLDTTDELTQFYSVLYGGDIEKGFNIFTRNEAAQCIRCHFVDGQGGGKVGPELTTIASTLTRKDMLLSLISPSSRIAPGYGTVTLELLDGHEVVGILKEETASVIKIKDGERIRSYPKSSLKKIERSPSAMFDTGDLLSKVQLRDLMAYLMTLH